MLEERDPRAPRLDLLKWFKDVKSTGGIGLEKVTKPIEFWVADDRKDWERLKEKSNDERFIRFFLELLRRGQGDIYINEDKIATELKINDIPSVDYKELYKEFRKELMGVGKGKKRENKREDIFRKLEQSKNPLIKNNLLKIRKLFDYTIGYRWGSWQAVYVLIGARSIIKPENDGFNKYVKEAKEKSGDNDFYSDKLLQLKFIGPKVRDLALTLFLDEYIAIDQFVKDVVMKTGLIRYYNRLFNEDAPEDPNLSDKKQYLAVWKMLRRICKIINVAPREVDRVLWHFGGKYEDENFSRFHIKNYSSRS